MAGNAKTTAFNIGTATVMIGPMEDVENLNPREHSIGLVKNFNVSATDNYTDLTQGIQNDIVWSEKTGSDVTATMEVYEYTPKNLAYALGLKGEKMVMGDTHNITSASGSEVIIKGESSGEDFMKGDKIIIQSQEDEDLVYVGKCSEVGYQAATSPEIALDDTVLNFGLKMNELMGSFGNITIDGGFLKLVVAEDAVVTFSEPLKTVFGFTDVTGPATGNVAVTTKKKLSAMGIVEGNNLTITINEVEYELIAKTSPKADTFAKYTITLESAIPVNMVFKAGDSARRVNVIYVGSREAQPFLGAKVVGILPDGKKPIVIIFPKIRITNGFNIGFQSDNYSNMPFEFTPFRMVESDPLYEEHKGGLLYVLE